MGAREAIIAQTLIGLHSDFCIHARRTRVASEELVVGATLASSKFAELLRLEHPLIISKKR